MLNQLELKLPPPLVMLAAGSLSWGVARLTPVMELSPNLRLVGASILAGLGGLVALAGLIEFRRAGTTIHPLHPEKTSALVQSGIYRYSRNPMYLGLLCLLLAWSLWLSAPLALIGPVLFVVFIQRFQIRPEEQALAKRFGAEFDAYRQRVRPWL